MALEELEGVGRMLWRLISAIYFVRSEWVGSFRSRRDSDRHKRMDVVDYVQQSRVCKSWRIRSGRLPPRMSSCLSLADPHFPKETAHDPNIASQPNNQECIH